MVPASGPISHGSCVKTQEKWVLPQDLKALGPDAGPKRHGSWWWTQTKCVLTQDPRTLDPDAGSIELGPDTGPKTIWFSTQENYNKNNNICTKSNNIYNTNNYIKNSKNIYNTNNNISYINIWIIIKIIIL